MEVFFDPLLQPDFINMSPHSGFFDPDDEVDWRATMEPPDVNFSEKDSIDSSGAQL